jgi:molecular chaperone GrpE
MPQDEATSPRPDGAQVLADITDQTLAEEAPGDIPSAQEDVSSNDPAVLQAQLEAANRRADDEHAAYLRARADFANYKRRAQEEAARQRAILTEHLLTRLLPIVDNFERALASAQTTQDYDKLIGGVSAILRQMQDFLTREGISVIESVGQPFDPKFHNAVAREETTEYPENMVVEELQKGYTLGERVLRPSMVKVATGAE